MTAHVASASESQSASVERELTPARERALIQKLRGAGLRTTRQRVHLAHLLFRQGDRHLTAEMLYAEAQNAQLGVSLATVYNTLNQFLDAGLLREVIVDRTRSYYDTNLGAHHHFYIENTGELIDVASHAVDISDLPKTPEGYKLAGVDVVLRLQARAFK